MMVRSADGAWHWAMPRWLIAVLAVIALSLPGAPARAGSMNLVTDGTFQSLSSNITNPDGGYVCNNSISASCSSNLTYWSGTCGTMGCGGNYSPGSLLIRGTSGAGFNLDYSHPGLYWNGIGDVPGGGNEVALDADSNFSQQISQTINGLVAGQSYVLVFYQASAQEISFSGATTEQWKVTLGDTTQYSPLQNTASQSADPWTVVTMDFQATSASEVLTFLAMGSPHNEPPIVLLGDVSLMVPEPGTWAVFGCGLLALGCAVRQRRS